MSSCVIGWETNTKESDSIYTNNTKVYEDHCKHYNTIDIKNIKWKEFCKRTTDIKHVDLNLDPPINNNTVLLSNTVKTSDEKEFSMIHLSTNSHLIPIIENLPINITMSSGEKYYSGIIVSQTDNKTIRTFSYIPFNTSKKVFSIMLNYNGIYYVSYVSSDMYNVHSSSQIIFNNLSMRNKESPITQKDRVLCLILSEKFENLAKNSSTFLELYAKIINELKSTIDPNYIIKILELSKRLGVTNVTD
jgi:hypothetical protein